MRRSLITGISMLALTAGHFSAATAQDKTADASQLPSQIAPVPAAPSAAATVASAEPPKPEPAPQSETMRFPGAITAPPPGLADAVPAPKAEAAPVLAAPAPTPAPVVAETPKPEPQHIIPPNAIALPQVPSFETPAPKTAEAPPIPKPDFELALEITQRLGKERGAGPDRIDRDAATKFYAARQGEPLWVTPTGLSKKAKGAAATIADANSWGLDAKQFRLPEDLKNPNRAQLADAEITMMLAAMKYARHARGGRNPDLSLLSKSFDRKPQVIARDSLLTEFAAASEPGAYLLMLQPQSAQFQALRNKLVDLRAGKAVVPPPAPPAAPVAAKGKGTLAAAPAAAPVAPAQTATARAALEQKLIANLEMWRWMPELGNYYIQSNIPEFMFRVVRDGKVVHTERTVTGKIDTPTPLFSETMKLLVFQPFWNVPESIKVHELAPQLARGGNALEKAGLKAAFNGRELTTSEIRGSDIRALHVYQPPGPDNVLGQIKFLFPNKHDVYMHDTSSRSLFSKNVRAFSHGCMRVRDPLKFAEVLLGQDKNWTREDVDKLAVGPKQNNEIRLTKPVPVHVTYFTAWVDDVGHLKTADDLYGHENRIHMGLAGRAAELEPHPKPPETKLVVRRGGDGGATFRPAREPAPDTFESWVKKVFAN